MKKTNRIRIFFLLTAILMCLAYYVGYQYIAGNGDNENIAVRDEQLTEAETETSVESANVTVPYKYLVAEEEGYLCVYMDDKDTLYMYTDIKTKELPAELQEEVKTGKEFTNLEELYRFLESYSS